jgi:hypothetical protein
MDDLEAIGRLLEALRPWHRHLVLVGGWAHRLHRFHPLADPPAYVPIRTRDADFAILPAARLAGDMATALKQAGFEEEFSGEEHPPVAQYHLGDADRGFYVEFLAPLTGSGRRRDGSADATVRRAGVVAQKLRHVDVLLVKPWTVGLSQDVGVAVQKPVEIPLANPVTFMAQRLLIHDLRPPAKRAQDLLYIHDTLDLFGPRLEALRQLWVDQVRPELSEQTAQRIVRLQREQFSTVSDAMSGAARIAQGRVLSPERLWEACAYGLGEVFGVK